MLPVAEIAKYARSWAYRHGVKDGEEAESVAVAGLWDAHLDKQHDENAIAYYKSYTHFRLLQAFYNKKKPGRLPDDFDMEYNAFDPIPETLEALKLSDVEAEIVKLRLQGYTDPEIAQRRKQSTAYINKVRVKIRNRTDETSLLN